MTLLSMKEVAAILDVSRYTLARLLDKGKLPFVQVGPRRCIHSDDVEAYKEMRGIRRKEELYDLTKISLEAGGYQEIERFKV